ncbi:MAG: hypothetical protein JKY31_08195 [Rhodobacteraceae bacterium]|nr:hypothetical protein [Paracoccaceae bacterium]
MKDITLEQLKIDFEMFRDQCRLLVRTKNNFDSLYSDDSVKKILYASAKHFFDDLHRCLTESYFLQVGRITDSVSSFGKLNLSASYLVEKLDELGVLSTEIKLLSEKINTYRTATSSARNKYFAHLDLDAHREQLKLGGHSWDEMYEFQVNLNRFTDCVGKALGCGPLDYSSSAGDGDVLTLIHILEKATKDQEN